MTERLLQILDRFGDRLTGVFYRQWWRWPLFLVLLMLATWTSALVVEPRPDQWSYVFGHRIGDTCAWIQLTGNPCPSCGMTRSFAWAARLRFSTAWHYNPAGLVLFWWITAGGLVGVVRLLTRDPERLSPPSDLLLGAILAWTIGLYALGWVLRMAGVNPLP